LAGVKKKYRAGFSTHFFVANILFPRLQPNHAITPCKLCRRAAQRPPPSKEFFAQAIPFYQFPQFFLQSGKSRRPTLKQDVMVFGDSQAAFGVVNG